MASAPVDPAEWTRQYWLDVPRPIAPRPPRERTQPRAPRRSDDAVAARQMELRMAVRTTPAPVADAAPSPPRDPAPVPTPAPPIARERVHRTEAAPPAEPARPCFVAWLRDQHKKGGMVGELAKAARLDPMFPKSGNADAVRTHFNRAGADGDAFEALDDAERAYDRLA